MANLVDFNTVDLSDATAGHVMPGDWIDTGCGIGAHAYVRVISIRYIEDDRPNAKDRVEFTLDVPAHRAMSTICVNVCMPIRFGRPC